MVYQENTKVGPAFLFSFVAEIELNGLPRRGWQTSFCNSYLCEMPPLSRASLFCENWQGGELNVFEQTGSSAQQKLDDFLREVEIQIRQISNCIPNEFIICYPICQLVNS